MHLVGRHVHVLTGMLGGWAGVDIGQPDQAAAQRAWMLLWARPAASLTSSTAATSTSAWSVTCPPFYRNQAQLGLYARDAATDWMRRLPLKLLL